MHIFAIVEMGGEGRVRAFTKEAAAASAAKKSDGYVLEKPPASMAVFIDGATGVAARAEVAGQPSKVWLVVCGDRGCTNGFQGAFVDSTAAKAAAAEAEAADSLGLSYWAIEVDVE